MLHLKGATSQDWAQKAILVMDDILLDHAHLEKKAASTALQMLFIFGHEHGTYRVLSELAREELAHFELVTSIMERRGLSFKPQRPGHYPGKMRELLRQGAQERMLDLLITSALIEARSCERMSLLSETLTDVELQPLYAGLLRSEARHHMTYLDMAAQKFGDALSRQRLAELADAEAEIVRTLPTEARLHSNL